MNFSFYHPLLPSGVAVLSLLLMSLSCVLIVRKIRHAADNELSQKQQELEDLKANCFQLEAELQASNARTQEFSQQMTVLIESEKQAAVDLAVRTQQISSLESVASSLAQKEEQLHVARETNTTLRTNLAKLEVAMANEKQQAQEKIELLNNAKDQLKLEFENLANKIFESKGKKFADQNQENISGVLNPLKEQIKEFKTKVEDVYVKESKDRTSLYNEIVNLKNPQSSN